MIQINQLKLPVDHSMDELEQKIKKILRLSPKQKFSFHIRKRSIDARKKPDIYYSYVVSVEIEAEQQVLKRVSSPFVQSAKDEQYSFPERGKEPLGKSPVIVGAGPAGLFCAFLMTELGYAPVVLERGNSVEKRTEDVHRFWKAGILNPDSNVQFGEGGAGTFSDGKLNTIVKDKACRNRFVLETFVRFGAPERILYDAKPHIGTDVLSGVILAMRKYLTEHGCRFYFNTCMTDLILEDGKLQGVRCRGHGQTAAADSREENSRQEEPQKTAAKERKLRTNAVVLALGHSARDTFEMLNYNKISMISKEFAVGFRIEHPQEMIDEAMYGITGKLEAAPYKVTANFPNGRGVYSFCMCPGGYVVNASSIKGETAVNGMSYSGRNGKNANSAIIVSVGAADFGADDALAGMRYQKKLEREAFLRGQGKIPQQLFGDFQNRTVSSGYGAFTSAAKGQSAFADLRGILSPVMEESLLTAMTEFARKIPGFDREDAILSGVESRTSSPVRILRDENMESSIKGIYPCGEGAGYAGGIMSAAMDGMKTAEAVIRKYYPAYE